jgi:hypothetical protein
VKGQAHIFTSYSTNRRDSNENEAISIVEVCKATSAAPKYFQKVPIGQKRYCDGSILTTNPSCDFIEEINEHSRAIGDQSGSKHRIVALISIGCGSEKRSRNKQALDDGFPHRLEEGHRPIRLAGPDDLLDLDLDRWKWDPRGEATFKEIEDVTERYCRENWKSLQHAADLLVQYRRARSQTSQWERYAFGIRYTCHLCTKEKSNFDGREDVIEHMRKIHNEPPPDPVNWNRIQTLLRNSQVFGMPR